MVARSPRTARNPAPTGVPLPRHPGRRARGALAATTAGLRRDGVAQPRRPRARDAAAAQRAEAPWQVGGARDADPRAGRDVEPGRPGGRGPDPDRPTEQRRAVEVQLDAERLLQLAGARAQLLEPVQP